MPTTVTKTVKSAGGDYSSLSGWEAGQQADLTAADQIQVAECYSFQDTTSVNIDGWTTDSTRYIRIYTPTSERHDGKWNTSKYRLDFTTSASTQFAMHIGESFTRLEGLQIKTTISGNHTFIRDVQSGINTTDVRIQSCVLVGDSSASADTSSFNGIYASDASSVGGWIVTNSVVYGFLQRGGYGDISGIGVYLADDSARCLAYNVTVQNCSRGFHSPDASGTTSLDPLLKNCIAQDCVDGYAGTFHTTSTNNCSDIASDAPGSSAQTGEVVFVSEGSENFHLDATDSFARGLGADLSADSVFAFSDDIDGQTRTVPWDIGADESFFTIVMDLANGTSTTSNTTVVTGSTVTANVGDMLVVVAASSNDGTNGAASMTTVVDSDGVNTYTQRALINYDPGAAGAGATLGLYTCSVTSALSGDTITVNHSGNTTEKAVQVYRVIPGSGYTLSFLSADTTGVTGSATSFSAATVSVTSGDIIFGAASIETDDAITGDSDTTNGSWSNIITRLADAGADASTMSSCSQYKYVTATGNQDWACSTATARDSARTYLILRPISSDTQEWRGSYPPFRGWMARSPNIMYGAVA